MNILTEEELKQTVRKIEIMWSTGAINLEEAKELYKLVDSHKSLFSANAELTERNRLLVLENDELNAENLKLKESLNKVKDHLEGVMNPRRFVILDGPGMIKTLSQALEDGK